MYAFIVNRIAGGGKGKRIWKKVEKQLQKLNVRYHVYFTERKKEATDVARMIVKEGRVEAVVVVGGDGTVHEVVNGLVGTDLPLSVIPAGSGNDYARALDIPKNYRKAIEQILAKKKRTIDVGKVNGKYCLTVIGTGFDGSVARKVEESRLKKWLNTFRLGKLIYAFVVPRVLFSYEKQDVSIVVDGQKTYIRGVWMIAVANVSCYAGGMKICPNAKEDDGYFDVCIVKGMSKFTFFKTFPLVFFGKHTHHRDVMLLSGKKVTIRSEKPLLVHGDGEAIGQTPITVEIIPRALAIC